MAAHLDHDGALERDEAVATPRRLATRASSGVAIALGDVLALPRALARDVLTRALASLEEPAQSGPSEDATVALITIALGQAVEGLHADLADDGRVNRHAQHATAFARIASIALRGYLAALRRGER